MIKLLILVILAAISLYCGRQAADITLFFYQHQLNALSESNHVASEEFARQYDICVKLMTQKLDKYWDIIH